MFEHVSKIIKCFTNIERISRGFQNGHHLMLKYPKRLGKNVRLTLQMVQTNQQIGHEKGKENIRSHKIIQNKNAGLP